MRDEPAADLRRRARPRLDPADPRRPARGRPAGDVLRHRDPRRGARGHELSAPEGRADTRRALDRLRALDVVPDRWRTPWGVQAPWTEAVAREHGLALCGWDVDTHDWRGDSAEAMLAATGPELRDDAVVLLHDGLGPGALRTGCEETLRFVQLLGAEVTA